MTRQVNTNIIKIASHCLIPASAQRLSSPNYPNLCQGMRLHSIAIQAQLVQSHERVEDLLYPADGYSAHLRANRRRLAIISLLKLCLIFLILLGKETRRIGGNNKASSDIMVTAVNALLSPFPTASSTLGIGIIFFTVYNGFDFITALYVAVTTGSTVRSHGFILFFCLVLSFFLPPFLLARLALLLLPHLFSLPPISLAHTFFSPFEYRFLIISLSWFRTFPLLTLSYPPITARKGWDWRLLPGSYGAEKRNQQHRKKLG